MNRLIGRVVAASALAAVAGVAQAQLNFSGGSFASIGTYDNGTADEQVDSEAVTAGIVDPSFSIGPLGVNVTVTFLGEEAANINRLDIGSLSVLNSDPKGWSYGTFFIAAGSSLSGTFTDVTLGGTSPLGGSGPGYGSFALLGNGADLASFTKATVGVGGTYDWIIGFNDDQATDADYDDLVIGIKVTAIPEPGTYALMLAGLAAVGFIGRRRRNI